MALTPINVVAGIIFNEDKSMVLLSLRKPDQHQGNCWEFPGGKVEPLEALEKALSRELNEELGIHVSECAAFCQIEHEYTDKAVKLHFWQVTQFSGVPVGRESQQLKWVALNDLAMLTFPDANKPVVVKLMQTILNT